MQLINLKTDFLGRECEFFEQLDSTQAYIWRMIENNTIKNGSLVMANIQTRGVGTHGRVWHTDEKNNIAFSFYIEMDFECRNLAGITIDIAKILANIFRTRYNVEVSIKEPNDLVINGKKIGGILTESKISCGKVKCLVVGIGINTNKVIFNEDIVEIATSIKKEYGIEVNNNEIVSQFCNDFEKLLKERMDK